MQSKNGTWVRLSDKKDISVPYPLLKQSKFNLAFEIQYEVVDVFYIINIWIQCYDYYYLLGNIFFNHGCYLASFKEILSVGLVFNNCYNKSLQSSSTTCQNSSSIS